ncbi:hypothetical protein O6H91_11G110500 [Diphasiastrum complanatum]|uniref:Uncharacterized protein n=4 Tax=Diphasiastrum complanatum TaxID=34168 RepID=A0ACC2CD04_DIPCM|nr:hypothetical protein O6H91_11G110500 [Diphasiastrum complanatum]KAJ7539827.1 hypothetical protein O6H91_11G110500 [Diphasiastrum complanatum]
MVVYYEDDAPPQRRLARTYTAATLSEAVLLDSAVVPSSLSKVAPILRVANDIEHENKRVAYLCRFYAFEKAHEQDPMSVGRGVRQFKTTLLQHLEKDNDYSMKYRTQTSDAREIETFYQAYYEKYVKDREGAYPDRAILAKAYQTASVLFEVLQSVNKTEGVDPAAETMATKTDVENKKGIFAPFNILPLDRGGEAQAIMQLDEVKSSLKALRNTRGLQTDQFWFREHRKDIFDWLEAMFGFQKDSVMNQREHLILLLANLQTGIDPESATPSDKLNQAIDAVMKKLFKNYRDWCRFLGIHENLRLPEIYQEHQQRKIVYIGLYLLIWGEAANLRFMPECLCYIFHQMAKEVSGILSGEVSYITGEYMKPAYGGDQESFLQKVVTPIYNVIRKEAHVGRKGTAPHSAWRNYDDLNEYFWSVDCFSLGWPMQVDHKFFSSPQENTQMSEASIRRNTRDIKFLKKTGFVEIRSFWHLFRSFHRMWIFFILSFQVMLVIAWSGARSVSLVFSGNVFHKVLSVFITAAGLGFLQGVLDVVFNLKAYYSLKYSEILRLLLKLLVAAAWVIVLSVCYVQSGQTSNGLTLRNGRGPSSYVLAVIVYLVPDVLGVVFFMLPMLSRWIEKSNWCVVRVMLWWSQSRLYVGRGMQESWPALMKYTLFWMSLLTCKLLFSYYIEIKPLVEPTKSIMSLPTNHSYAWHEFFPQDRNNTGAVISLWAPVALVYFMDTQIWYFVFMTLTGGFIGATMHLGEIRTLGMLRSRFGALPNLMFKKLVPGEKLSQENFTSGEKLSHRKFKFLKKKEQYESGKNTAHTYVFGQIWNEVIAGFRKEDLINNKEMELMLVPYTSSSHINTFRWPRFLLGGKLQMAIQIAEELHSKDIDLKDEELWRRIKADVYMHSAVQECYDSLKYVLQKIIHGEAEKRIVNALITQVEEHIGTGTFLLNFRMSALSAFCEIFSDLIGLLIDSKVSERAAMILVLQDMFEVVAYEMLGDKAREELESTHGPLARSQSGDSRNIEYFATLEPMPAVLFPPQREDGWSKLLERVHWLLSNKESTLDIPKNLEARSRLSFFTNSLFMDMPTAPRVHNMCSFSILTPYYDEEIIYNKDQLQIENEDGISILFYLQKIYPDEWKNFLERLKLQSEGEAWEKKEDELRHWASFCSQTLSRTVRGMMYYKNALLLQAFQELAPQEDINKGYKAAMDYAKKIPQQKSYWEKLYASIDLKYTYIVTCQNYGAQKQLSDLRAKDIVGLMKKYPSLRVAYIDEEEGIYHSVLVKWIDDIDQDIYRIKLPGPAIIGEGKPENQNHAIIFTRGEALETIDMNQDNYFEEAIKIRNLLEEFKRKSGVRAPSILGFREHIFTGSVSSIAWFKSVQESSFGTIGQRVLANPLKVRFHYGHPDVFDRLFHITRGGVSKASKGINLNNEIYAGCNSILRCGCVTHHEYIQVGKGRDVGLNQISIFEAKVAMGNGEQTLNRDNYRLGHRFDFFRMMSYYFTTIGYYFNLMLVVLTVYVFLYGRLYLVLSGLESALIKQARKGSYSGLEAALASQTLVQLGLIAALPIVMEIGLEKGFYTAISDFFVMQLQLASVFFAFSLGTKAHYYGQAILHGGARYKAAHRGFVVRHESFAEIYRLYSRSHFTKGFEIVILLIVYAVYGSSPKGHLPYLLLTISMWFLAGTWLFAPFLFNPSGFEWQKVVEDWSDWNKWINSKASIGALANKSWESWWEEQQEHLKYTGLGGRVWEGILSIRFFLYQYGLVYRLHITRHHKGLYIYGISWLVLVGVFIIIKIFSVVRQRFISEYGVAFRLLKGLLYLCSISIVVVLFRVAHFTIGDVFTCILAFTPTGWAILQIAQAGRPLLDNIGGWNSIRAMARAYEFIMGLVLIAPIAVLAWLPFVSELQTRLLFNQAFSRGLQISRILDGRKKKIAQD